MRRLLPLLALVLLLLFFLNVILVSSTWVSSALGRAVSVPIRKLTQGTRAIAGGELDYRIATGGSGEFADP